MTSSQVVPVLLVPFIAWRIYSRVHRNIGRQPYRPKRLLTSAIIFGVITLLIGLAAMAAPRALASLVGGLAVAVALSFVALRLTKWENSRAGEFYIPNTNIGLAVIVLFMGRMLYRVVLMTGLIQTSTSPASTLQSPLTLFVFGITSGYYFAYSLGLYLRGRHELEAKGK
jgi:hypothetical protein